MSAWDGLSMFNCDGCNRVMSWSGDFISSQCWVFCIITMIIMMLLCFVCYRYKMKHLPRYSSCCDLNVMRSMKSGFTKSTESARDILDKRFASGEISKEEYEDIRQVLDKNLNENARS